MAHEQAVAIVNTFYQHIVDLARGIATALDDGKVSPWEGMHLGMQGMATSSYLMSMLQGLDKATRDDVLFVLEHSERVLPPGMA